MARVDIDVVARVPRDESYWAAGRAPATAERLVREASRVVGLYRDGTTVGFCRIVSDDATFAFLFDVFVLADHRGTGRGVELVREAVENGPHRDLPWHLGTSDAHGLYERFGFGPPDARTPDVPSRREPDLSRCPVVCPGTSQSRSSTGRRRHAEPAARPSTSSTQSGWLAIRTRAPTSPCRWPASA